MQTLLNQFLTVCSGVGLTISLTKSKALSKGIDIPPTIKIDDKCIENVKNFVYLGSSIALNASTDTEIKYRISKASGTVARLYGRVWYNPNLTICTKTAVYRACDCRTIMYGSKTWTLSNMQVKKINIFHQQCHCWEISGNMTLLTNMLLKRTGLTIMYTTFSQPRFRWWATSVGRWQTQRRSTKITLQRRLQARLEELECWHWWVEKLNDHRKKMALSYQGETAWKGKAIFRRPKKKTNVQEKIINTFHQRCFCRILRIRWQHGRSLVKIFKNLQK